MAESLCKIPDCGRKYYAFGFCVSHHRRERKGLPLDTPITWSKNKVCEVEGCNRPHAARGYCKSHWQRAKDGNVLEAEFRVFDSSRICNEPYCDEPYLANGKCGRHYMRRWTSPSICVVQDCGKTHKRLGYCGRHADVVEKYGEEYLDLATRIDKNKEACRMKCGNTAKVIDHDHNTGKVRGALCPKCNRGLGLLGDTIESIERALAYLKGEI